MNEYETWLDNLAVGDKVFQTASGALGSTDSISTVERITKTLIVTKTSRFSRHNGTSPGGGYYHSRLEEATQENIDSIRKNQLVAAFKRFDWDALTLDKLNAINALRKSI